MTLAFELSKHNKKCVYKAMYKKWKQTKNKDIWKKILQFRTNSACILKKKKKWLTAADSIFPIAIQNAYLG